MFNLKSIFGILLFLVFISNNTIAQNNKIKISEDLELIQISDKAYIHISYHEFKKKRTSANGLIYINSGEALIVDTPWGDQPTQELISWLRDSLHLEIEGCIATHWHDDCMGGLGIIQKEGVKSYSHNLTCKIAKSKNLPIPEIGFQDSLKISLGNKEIICQYFGAGHTLDNIVVWIPDGKILFGGCMLKALNWKGLGYLKDADVIEWPKTLKKLLLTYPESKIVIPGHGKSGDNSIIYHTLELVENHNKRLLKNKL